MTTATAKVAAALLLIALLGGVALPVIAQMTGALEISPAEVDRFPAVSFFLKAYDDAGFFITDLRAEDLQVVEDGNPLPVDLLERQQPGLQLVVAINAGLSMDFRINEVSRLEMLRTALVDWAGAQPADTPDALGLVTNTGISQLRMTSPQAWEAAFAAFTPDLTVTVVSPGVMGAALDVLTDLSPRPYMQRVVLYITSLPMGRAIEQLPAEVDRAASLDVQVHVWLVGSSTISDTYQADLLRSLAERTGGSYALFTGVEPVPDFETLLQPDRYVYRLGYTSRAGSSGAHRVAVQLERGDILAISPETTYNITVEPPNPIFLSPPSRVARRWVTGADGAERLEPVSLPLKLLVEFPDGHPRALTFTRLYVNDELAVEVTEAPFDALAWDLTPYSESQSVTLRLEVGDSLGLSKSTIDLPVDLEVAPVVMATPPAVAAPLIDGIMIPVVIAGGVLLIVAAAFILRMLAQKRQAHPNGLRLGGRSAGDEPSLLISTVPRLFSSPSAPARLVRLSESGNPIEGMIITFKQREVVIGSDAQKANILLENPSVDAAHARLIQAEDKSFRLMDNGSLAGTWVNYSPVSKEGVLLEHGDLVNFGKLAFRFEESQPRAARQPVVNPVEGPL